MEKSDALALMTMMSSHGISPFDINIAYMMLEESRAL
jgi:hypothetical protein